MAVCEDTSSVECLRLCAISEVMRNGAVTEWGMAKCHNPDAAGQRTYNLEPSAYLFVMRRLQAKRPYYVANHAAGDRLKGGSAACL